MSPRGKAQLGADIDRLFETPGIIERIHKCFLALQLEGLEGEARGIVLGQLKALDFIRNKLLSDTYPDEDVAALRSRGLLDLLGRHNSATTPSSAGPERVAPLPSRFDWRTR